MFSILERNGEKRKGKYSLFNNFLISIHYTKHTTHYTKLLVHSIVYLLT